MNTDFDDLWPGNWREELNEFLKNNGYDSINAFLSEYPKLSYWALSEKLGERFAPMQIMLVQAEMAVTHGDTSQAAQDCLARKFFQHLPTGWGHGNNVEFNTAGVYTDWVEFLEFLGQAEYAGVKKIWMELKQNTENGWSPTGVNDERLNALFSRHWHED